MFSKKAIKNDEIFTVDLTLTTSVFVAFLENTNFIKIQKGQQNIYDIIVECN